MKIAAIVSAVVVVVMFVVVAFGADIADLIRRTPTDPRLRVDGSKNCKSKAEEGRQS